MIDLTPVQNRRTVNCPRGPIKKGVCRGPFVDQYGVMVLPVSRIQDPSKTIGTVVQLANLIAGPFVILPVDLFKCERVVIQIRFWY